MLLPYFIYRKQKLLKFMKFITYFLLTKKSFWDSVLKENFVNQYHGKLLQDFYSVSELINWLVSILL